MKRLVICISTSCFRLVLGLATRGQEKARIIRCEAYVTKQTRDSANYNMSTENNEIQFARWSAFPCFRSKYLDCEGSRQRDFCNVVKWNDESTEKKSTLDLDPVGKDAILLPQISWHTFRYIDRLKCERRQFLSFQQITPGVSSAACGLPV